MEADRGAVLTLRAAARGVVDFAQARVSDVRWWRRFNALVRAMAAEDDLVALRLAFDLHRSLVGNGSLSDSSFKACQEAARGLFADMVARLYPWDGRDRPGRRQAKLDELVAEYKRLLGDPDDPEFQAKLEHDRKVFASGAPRATPPETDEERVDRLILERNRSRSRR